jgi:MATE family multidrug resistance protein
MKHPILRIVLPSILSNITVPLLGLVDTAIVGHLGGAAYIGAIALGGMLFNMVYWLFGFLRMGTGGLTAQAYGAGQQMEAFRTLCRALTVGVVIGLLFIAACPLLLALLFSCVPATPQVADLTRCYVGILVVGAPAVMALYAFSGWFLGMQNARYPLYVSVLQNVVNIVVSLWLVVGCGWQVDGIATGTLVAQYAGLLTAVVLWRCRYRSLWCRSALRRLWQRGAVSRFFRVHRDIFLRTLCLVAVTTWFTSAGTALGEDILAANALLMQLFVVFSYFMDGWAYAGEALGGRYVGAADRAAYLRLGRHLMGWGGALALLFTLVYALGGAILVGWLTSDAAVQAVACHYLPFAVAVPLAGGAAFIYDGLFIGATATRQMCLSMAVAAAVFFALWGVLPRINASLWTAFLAYLLCRGGLQALLYRSVVAQAFDKTEGAQP